MPNQRCRKPDWPSDENVLAKTEFFRPANLDSWDFVADAGLDSDKFYNW
jgi:hypothetical protein|tara:strand:+ start:4461 stop:4607 length:147 start_codon:yes stop_codon:yes gene_type:complete